MRWSQSFIPTLKEEPSDAEVPSHRLMLRAGLIRQLMAGAYTYLPLGYRALRKAEAIVREEMDRAGAVEIHMPAIQPIELFERTGRIHSFGNVLIHFDVARRGQKVRLALGPTHEEVITDLISRHVSSYRQLPFTLYQIQTKFRNEERPRFGILRTSEFLMKDAYSFSASVEQLDQAYQAMYDAYCRIFSRCGLEYVPVEAESGPIGGDASHEFMVPAPNGEDRILRDTKSGYAANIERAVTGRRPSPVPAEAPADAPPMKSLDTPGTTSIEQVSKLLKCKPHQMIKTLIYLAINEFRGGRPQPVAVLIRGDHEANENKIRRVLGAESLELADEETIQKVTGAPVGFAGPVGIRCPVIVDHDIPLMEKAVVGANAADAHLVGVRIGRDWLPSTVGELQAVSFKIEGNADDRTTFDLRNAAPGDPSPKGDGTLELVHGIEVGHVFKLGAKYSVSLAATFVDEKEQSHPIIMGCYGIGVNRILAGLVETRHDADGIIWPISVAPYEVVVVPLNVQDPPVMELAERYYRELQDAGVDVLLDDRDLRAGAKFKDADLVGFPLRLVIGGKGLQDGVVELKWRDQPEAEKVPVADAVAAVRRQVAERQAALKAV
ncbi:MAG: proline--tRNA ligase [Planctomyces sp.]|nr:proline--tRNA ligase [Planctomyces sp.]